MESDWKREGKKKLEAEKNSPLCNLAADKVFAKPEEKEQLQPTQRVMYRPFIKSHQTSSE